jgi:hypothetical protein
MVKVSEHFIIQLRYFVENEGWKYEEHHVDEQFEAAGRMASRYAYELDAKFGDDGWTVDLVSPNGGSYFQLFHGRLS